VYERKTAVCGEGLAGTDGICSEKGLSFNLEKKRENVEESGCLYSRSVNPRIRKRGLQRGKKKTSLAGDRSGKGSSSLSLSVASLRILGGGGGGEINREGGGRERLGVE